MERDSVRVLLHSSGLLHPSIPARVALRRGLGATPCVRLDPVGGLDAISACLRGHHRGLVAYFHDREANPATLEIVEAFVHRGGGLLAVHAAAASFKKQPRWREILGGRFVGHGPVQDIRVEPSAEEDPVFGKLPHFEVRDELYRHETDPGNTVHLHVDVDGEREPVLWTRPYGEGRVAYLSLGHKARALRHPSVVAVLQRALRWTLRTL